MAALLSVSEIEQIWSRPQIGEWSVAHHGELLQIVREGDDWRSLPAGALRALEAVVDPTPEFVDAIVEAGLRLPRKYRRRLYAIIGDDAPSLIRPFLLHKQLPYRTGAVEWVRVLKDPDAEKDLRTMIQKERNQHTKGIALAALEEIGGSLEEFISPDRLKSDARKAMLKEDPIPKELGWLNFSTLPQLRWADLSPVSLEVPRWFCAVAVKARDAEPSPIMRRHFASMDQTSVREFGNALFAAYVTHDLSPRWDHATARAKAQALVERMYDPENGQTNEDLPPREVLYPRFLQRFSEEPSGSDVASKNILAVVAATGTTDVIGPAYRFMKKWRGNRLGQGRAMIQMIANIDDPAAVQVLLAMSNRFRPKTLQNEAGKQAELLAERNDWTVVELADRSIPEADFDPMGRQTIDYGTRTFTAHLTDMLMVELTNDSTGRTIKNLPVPNQSDDAEIAKAAKSDFSAAKKDVKAVARTQPIRLYEAMCTERIWTAADFRQHVLNHPLMVRLAARLVWIATTDEQHVAFRPHPDGTPVSVQGMELPLAESATVRLAHDELMNTEDRDAWIRHIANDEVSLLFAQFNRPAVAFELEQKELTDFEGHMIDALVLRGQIEKAGWQTGPAEDAGYSSLVERQFPAAGFMACLTHWGVPPESVAHQTAFSSLWFSRLNERRYRAVPLSTVPPILLREAYAQAKAIVSAGTGFDADHKWKVGLIEVASTTDQDVD